MMISTNWFQAMSAVVDNSLQAGDWSLATHLCQVLLQHTPRNDETLSTLAYALWQSDRNPEAVWVLRKALEINPNNAIAHNNLGVAYLDEFQSPYLAIECFKRAIEIDKSYELAKVNFYRARKQLKVFHRFLYVI